MQSERLLVKCIKVNNCFAYLPDNWLRKLETKENVIEIVHRDKTYYASCIASPTPDRTLCLGTTFARTLNIKEGEEVFVSSVKDVPHLTKVTVVPQSTNDREILELQIDKVQGTLLDQIRVVVKDQPIVVWVSKFSCVTVTPDSLDPCCSYGKLEQFTEVHVADTPANIKSNKADEPSGRIANIATNLRDAFKKILPGAFEETKPKKNVDVSAENHEFLQSFREKSKPGIYRVQCLPVVQSTYESNAFDEIARCPYHIFVPRKHVPMYTEFTNGFALFNVKKVEHRQHVSATGTNFLRNDDSTSVPKLRTELAVKLFVLEEALEKYFADSVRNHFNLDLLHSSVYVSESLKISLRLKTGSKVILRQIDSCQQPVPSSIEIFSSRNTVSAESFENYVKTHSLQHPFLINSCAAIILDDGNRCVVRISPENCTFAMIDYAISRNLVIHARSISADNDLPIFDYQAMEHFQLEKISTRHLRHILAECQITLDLSLGLRSPLSFEYDRENILIAGDVGSGKTTVCKILAQNLQDAPYFVHTHMIDCRSLKGKKAEILQKIITTALSECVYHQPSILFLDDLESITNASTNDEENTPDAINAARIADMLVNIVTEYQESHYVSIIATCASVNRIGQKLRPARGSHFFRTVLSIPNLEKVDRIDILQLMLGDKLYVPGDVNWDYYGNKTEGWMAQDLVDMAQKATFAAWKRHESAEPPIVVTGEDMSVALNNCTPMSLQGIQLYKDSGHVWSDIGGLREAKKSLVEILQWPLQYPEIFKNAPIKLQNGVLLYGMPGTGKTMLAKAIANECGVNLISVKGPELLSKYIGVSEESVRNVFERAHRAKPCVLFFDEFDSLAPRRGHDSTGVTDRVVNQLLTQMDGVEDREGVAVVAASSRPDLLDPALLRPGRLDKSLYCPLPSETDRQEILAALCNSQNVNADQLDLKELAELCSGFTGADLNAAVTQARLSAFEDAVAISSDGKVEAEDIKVTQRHLVECVKSTHPSLSAAEKSKYQRIYARFSNNENFTEDMLKNQKATLA